MRWLRLLTLSLFLVAGGAQAQRTIPAEVPAPSSDVPEAPIPLPSIALVEQAPEAVQPAGMRSQSTELSRFLYNVAVGVAVAVLSTLILRAIL